MNHSERYFVVVGGVNLDICGTPYRKMLPGDSNPGHVTLTPGGVGRNIAEDLCRMGCRVYMLTALGDDANADFIRRSCSEIGIDLSYALTVSGAGTSTYLCLNGADGELYAAVADMSVCDLIDDAYLRENQRLLDGAVMVVADANIPQKALQWLSEHCKAPLAADPVSVSKAGKLMSTLKSYVTLKPNRPEASLLTGVPIEGMQGVPEAAAKLLELGVQKAFVSLGASGVYYDDGHEHGIQPCCRGAIVNTTGCGDAFTAAAVLALSEGHGIREAALMGQAAASVCAEADSACNPDMTYEAVMNRMKEEIL